MHGLWWAISNDPAARNYCFSASAVNSFCVRSRSYSSKHCPFHNCDRQGYSNARSIFGWFFFKLLFSLY